MVKVGDLLFTFVVSASNQADNDGAVKLANMRSNRDSASWSHKP